MICKKGHLTEDADELSEQLEACLKHVVDSGDKKSDVIANGSDDEVDETAAATLKECCGYRDVTKKQPVACSKATKPYLWIEATHTRHFFCSVNHLLRYLALHYGKKGQAVARMMTMRERRQVGNHVFILILINPSSILYQLRHASA